MNPRVGVMDAARPLIALDVSRSWLRAADSTSWSRARTQALEAAPDSVLLVGHTVRAGSPPLSPEDTSTSLVRAAERAQLAGRGLRVYTDGESDDDPAVLHARMPAGSEVVVFQPVRGVDAALFALDAPAAALAGDTIVARVGIANGDHSVHAAVLEMRVDGSIATVVAVPPLAPFERRDERVQLRMPAGSARATIAARIAAPGDVEPRNDTAVRTIFRGARVSAAAVSTSPDVDFREAARVLRDALSVPTVTRARIAASRWVDESGRPVPEAQVRSEIAAAQVVLLHGDTSFFGPPRSATRGALALVPRPSEAGEWYISAVPQSPLAFALRSLPLDSLAPVSADASTQGAPILTVRSGQRTRNVGSVESATRRVIVLPLAGTSRWVLRGGVHADAFFTLWGAVFATLADTPGGDIPAAAVTLPPAELLPRPPSLKAGRIGEAAVAAVRRPVREHGWLFGLVAIFLCAEWMLRRRSGLR